MEYKKPICNCGRELIYTEFGQITKDYAINEHGKRFSKPFDAETIMQTEELQCPECAVWYEVDRDDRGRIKRGKYVV